MKEENQYQITLSESQMMLIARTLEDVSRFASGQMEMQNTIQEIVSVEWKDNHDKQIDVRDTAEWRLNKLKSLLFSKGGYGGYNKTPFVGNLYQIYKWMYKAFNDAHNINNVDSPEPLPSGNLGTIKIEKV